jgi:hypothetical protein
VLRELVSSVAKRFSRPLVLASFCIAFVETLLFIWMAALEDPT